MAPPIPTAASTPLLALLTAVLSISIKTIYNLYFHPLAKFPGPLAHRATRLAYLCRYVRGTLSRDLLAFHNQYGPIVRIAPNELAFNSPEAWREIYGHKAEEFPKLQAFYRPRKAPANMVTETRFNHRNLRLQIAPQFSDRSMREQEPVFRKYVNLLITQLREHAVDPDRKDEKTGLQAQRPLDMVAWYTWTTFDIIGDLAFGEPFGCLDKASEDPWIKSIFDAFSKAPYMACTTYLGLDNLLLPILRYFIGKGREMHDRSTEDKLRRRMEMKGGRHDLIEGFLSNSESLNLDFKGLKANASVLIIAGSETTSTLLSGTTYLLLRNPDQLKRLTDEVRSSFSSEDEITLLSVGKLNYMLACLNEGLRLYPPVPVGLPRVVPKGRGNVAIAGAVVPDDVSSVPPHPFPIPNMKPGKTVVAVWQWAAYHSEANFKDPFGFHPERFLRDPKFGNDKLDILQPFSVGPRNCVGRK
ncbi:hypothetical protein OQA88_839 [Cercophora sp. LCS_1]